MLNLEIKGESIKVKIFKRIFFTSTLFLLYTVFFVIANVTYKNKFNNIWWFSCIFLFPTLVYNVHTTYIHTTGSYFSLMSWLNLYFLGSTKSLRDIRVFLPFNFPKGWYWFHENFRSQESLHVLWPIYYILFKIVWGTIYILQF